MDFESRLTWSLIRDPFLSHALWRRFNLPSLRDDHELLFPFFVEPWVATLYPKIQKPLVVLTKEVLTHGRLLLRPLCLDGGLEEPFSLRCRSYTTIPNRIHQIGTA